MAKEILSTTDVGKIPESDEYQRVNQSPQGKTGEPVSVSIGDRISDVAHTVKGIFSEHSEKLFAITALIGFTLIFYAGNIKNWSDFLRYTAFLGIVLIFYLFLNIGKWICKKFSSKE
jgi:hypothetical protein